MKKSFINSMIVISMIAAAISISRAGEPNMIGDQGQSSNSTVAQDKGPVIYPDDPIELKNQFQRPTYFPEHIYKKPGPYTIAQWQDVIDSVWGMGLPRTDKLQIFDSYWSIIDGYFACFNRIDVNWDSLRTVYRGEIVNGDSTYGVSRGRFAAMLNHLSTFLRESHTNARDIPIFSGTSPEPGVPLQFVGGWGDNWHFGAGLTPLPDSSLLVYKSAPGHPLGLQPGDIVLGYDGIPWKDQYRNLLDDQLPLNGWWWGSSPSSFTHAMLMAAGLNWHLFDSLDVVKYATGDTLRLSVAPLIGENQSIWCTEQMDIPGVPIPDYNAGQRASYGIIDGTDIGYIYVIAWSGNAQQEFYNAVSSLMNNYETSGMIIDFRTNYGGNMFMSDSAFTLLFNETDTTINFAERCNTNDHLLMCPENDPANFLIHGDPSTYYNKPIAVLVGPGAVSSGDQVALRMKFHPMAKLFGEYTSAAFNTPYVYDLGYSDWYFRFAWHDAYLVDNPLRCLTHDEFPSEEDFPGVPFQEVWLTPDNVAQGIDDVVQAAVHWIDSCRTYIPGDVNGSDSYNGLDITYGVAYFKGGPAPSYQCECTPGNTWYVPGDVNGSCSYNGLDITYGVAYFKGGAGPEPCGDCPPGGILEANADKSAKIRLISRKLPGGKSQQSNKKEGLLQAGQK